MSYFITGDETGMLGVLIFLACVIVAFLTREKGGFFKNLFSILMVLFLGWLAFAIHEYLGWAYILLVVWCVKNEFKKK